jgi:NADH-quinone oxidoreductase subunit N
MIVLSSRSAPRLGIDTGEYYAIILSAATGMVLLVQAHDLVTLFVSLELLSLCVYILSGFLRRDVRSNEASFKYFVTGAFATGFLLYGMALLYGATGAVRLDLIAAALRQDAGGPLSLASVGMAMLVVGLGFKVGAVPFHVWVPDVYQGAPTPVTAFMSVTVKAAAFGAIVRIFLTAGGAPSPLWGDLLAGIAFATMIGGNLVAVWQRNVKRMLAYSSIAHTGYLLMGVAALARAGGTASQRADLGAATVFYLVVYAFMTFGAFAFLVHAGRDGRDAEELQDFAGLARRRPWAAAAMTLFMVSLAGIPPAAGFFGKFLLFKAAVATGQYALVVAGVLTSAVSVYYYLRVVVSMYMDPAGAAAEEKPSASVTVVVGVAALFTLLLGLVPSWVIALSQRSILGLLR